MSKEQIIEQIEILINLIKEKERFDGKINNLKNRGKVVMKFLMICSAVIYPAGIMLYMDGERLSVPVNIIVDKNISNEWVSFNALKFMILWSIFFLMLMVVKESMSVRNNCHIKKYDENVKLLEKKIEENSKIENINLNNFYCKINILNEFKNYLDSGRASNLKECMNYYEFHDQLNKIQNKIAGKGV